ncbi:MAG: hypothetical protein KGL02_09415, partial [Acidobacteriota bacterium]|nr:hypothetical protein [Acidobacteriota bacterium]
MTRRRIFRVVVLPSVLALAVALAIVAVRGAGRWLVCNDALRPSGVIVVLSGGVPWRAEEAARIFRMGYAHEVWITVPGSPSRELA